MTSTDKQWQQALLPFMKYMLIAFSVFFFSATIFQLYNLHQKIYYSAPLNLDDHLEAVADSSEFKQQQWVTIVKLEEHTLTRRYHQANVTLMSGIWIKYLGFLTGMIITLSGAVFILGKIEIKESKLDMENSVIGKNSLQSSSPGLFLALFGVVLMIFTSRLEVKVDVKDGPAFLTTYPLLNKKSTPITNKEINDFNKAIRKDSVDEIPD